MKNADEDLAANLAKKETSTGDKFAAAVKAGSADALRLQFANRSDDEARNQRQEQIELARRQADSLDVIAAGMDEFEVLE